ncbi:DUF350 domain-containing protein [Candidatus Micrarchaeota archaeon]|nr:DUF350 domain-containing protein [Candidatus Micrarchaeota archaeon]
MVQELFIGFLIAALRIVAAIGFSAGALYTGIGLFDRLTAGIEEWKEIKKGNAAIGLLFVSVMAAMALLMEQRILDLVYAIQPESPAASWQTVLLVLAFTFLNYLLGLLASVVVIFLTFNIADRITPDLDEFAELKKANMAVALILAAALILVVLAVRQPFESGFDLLISVESAFL